ncbi:MAG: type 1 glutamine amidotransferase [Acidobacteria bacterium]|nr:type 1 glutamine amidotransferase [Acidobacteriota bacterium]
MKTIRVLQHASFEGPAGLAGLALERGFELAVTRLDLGQPLPELATSGAVVVLGGPMSVHDEQAYPWLLREKRWIASAVEAGIPVVGICLGAQLLAHVLGATVSAMHEREIGWHRVHRAPEAAQATIGSIFPPTMLAFHWHGDTFALPAVPCGSQVPKPAASKRSRSVTECSVCSSIWKRSRRRCAISFSRVVEISTVGVGSSRAKWKCSPTIRASRHFARSWRASWVPTSNFPDHERARFEPARVRTFRRIRLPFVAGSA